MEARMATTVPRPLQLTAGDRHDTWHLLPCESCGQWLHAGELSLGSGGEGTCYQRWATQLCIRESRGSWRAHRPSLFSKCCWCVVTLLCSMFNIWLWYRETYLQTLFSKFFRRTCSNVQWCQPSPYKSDALIEWCLCHDKLTHPTLLLRLEHP